METLAPPANQLSGLNMLRTLAIALVYVFHYGRIFPHPEWTATISKFGWTGVDLFFVLSGYLIASQLFAAIQHTQTFSLKNFFIKRSFRILPAYFFVLIIYFCFPFVHERESLAPLWKYLTFTQNIGLDLRTQATFSHAWSLCIEEQFYLFFPLILLLLLKTNAFKKGVWMMLTFFIAGFFIRHYLYMQYIAPNYADEGIWAEWYKLIYYPTFCRLDGLLTGLGIAALFQFKPGVKFFLLKQWKWLMLAGLFVLVSAYFLCMEQDSYPASVLGYPLVSIGYGLLLMAAIAPANVMNRFGFKYKINIALLSFSIYLCHKFVIHVTQDLLFKLGLAKESNLVFLLCTVSTLLFSLLMYLFIEKPFLQWREKLLKVR